MLATYMLSLHNSNKEIRIAVSSCRPQQVEYLDLYWRMHYGLYTNSLLKLRLSIPDLYWSDMRSTLLSSTSELKRT